jgi:Arc/MetJ-type ribon-helix-helix transcriptional regulator
MSETTTIRVKQATRARIEAQRRPGQTADEVINEGLAAIEREAWRRQAEDDAREAAKDAVDRAEVLAAIQETLGE